MVSNRKDHKLKLGGNKIMSKLKNIVIATFSCMTLLSSTHAYGETINKPFPQHVQYSKGVIKPTNMTQMQMDNEVKKFYSTWKSKYLKQHPSIPDQYYVFINGTGEFEGDSVSEGHGFGMVITAYMAGYDPNAKIYFDGLYRFYKAHPSGINKKLMAWRQKKSGNQMVDTEKPSDSATDGDLDIAYSLLLADKQWGSNGNINYLSEAKSIINAIMQSDINQNENTVMLGDWSTPDETKYYTSTRSSDWMIDHFKAFQTATGDAKWKLVTDKTYSVANSIYQQFSPNTGLMPDFVIKKRSQYTPAPPNFLEASTDGSYSWNACRTPWRLATDYILTGDKRALGLLGKTNAWIQTQSKNNPANIYAGYKLNGTPIDPTDKNEKAFISPLAVSAMVDSKNQLWLNKLWENIVSSPSEGYYGDSIKMLSMIVISGNWWSI